MATVAKGINMLFSRQGDWKCTSTLNSPIVLFHSTLTALNISRQTSSRDLQTERLLLPAITAINSPMSCVNWGDQLIYHDQKQNETLEQEQD